MPNSHELPVSQSLWPNWRSSWGVGTPHPMILLSLTFDS